MNFRSCLLTVIDNLAFAALYALLGVLALSLAIEPGITTPIYPGAGLALAVVLLRKRRLLAGVFLGAMIVQLVAVERAGITPDVWLNLVVPAGACVQALWGAWLARRLDVWPSPLDSARNVVRLLCVVAPLGCVPLASIAMLAQSQAASTAAAVDGLAWLNWWAGDTLGAMLVTPIVLALRSSAVHWQGRRLGVVVTMTLAILIFGGSLMLVRQREEGRIANEFLRNAEHISTQVGTRLDSKLDILLALERHVALDPMLSVEDWSRLTSQWLVRYPDIINLTWNPAVRRDEVAAFQAAQRAAGRPDFTISDRGENGTLVAPGPTELLFPATYVEPLRLNERLVGLNVYSWAASREPIDLARETTRAAATNPFQLAQSLDGAPGVVIYQPVFERDFDPASQLLGIVSSAIRLDDVVGFVRAELTSAHIALCVIDPSLSATRARVTGPADCTDQHWVDNKLSYGRSISFADRQWLMLLRSDSPDAEAGRSWAAGMALLVTLFVAGLFSAFVLLTTGRARRTAELVAQRTDELARATQTLRNQHSLLIQAQHMAHMGSWELGAGIDFNYSEELLNVLGLQEGSLLDFDDLLERALPEERSRLRAAVERVQCEPGSQTLDCRMLDGRQLEQVLHFQIDAEWVGGQLLRIFGTVQNVTQARAAEARIQYLAHFDPLTTLSNRSHWLEEARKVLQVAQRHGDQAAVLFLDLDRFKTINDSLGHPVGDKLLTTAAQRLRKSLRSHDLLARQGGDEFVVMLPRLEAQTEAARVAEKLVASVAVPFHIDGHELAISTSVGIAYFPDDGQDIDTLLKHADLAMYGAKQAGRNQFRFFVPEMNERAMQRLKFESALRLAVERHEMVLHFQPQMDIASGLVVGCEALVRWQHPELGLVPPADFIPLAEDSGLILSLGDWILRAACAQQVRWIRSGMPLVVSVNIAALQFQQPDFVTKVRDILAGTGAQPGLIELEITESALLASSELLIERLDELRALGLRLALDDFGTGYSCLAYLKRLPLERLKIDRSFVRDLPGDAEDAAIASATLSMARDLGLVVTAEGVETRAQQDFLAARGCERIQGYLISRPLPAEAFTQWLRAREAAHTG